MQLVARKRQSWRVFWDSV